MNDPRGSLLTRIDGVEELPWLREIFAKSPSFSALLHGPDYRLVLTNPPYQQLVGRPVIGRTVQEAFPEVESQGFLALLDGVFSTGKPFVGQDVEIVFQSPTEIRPRLDFWTSSISLRREKSSA
jgi:hypothetical protein